MVETTPADTQRAKFKNWRAKPIFQSTPLEFMNSLAGRGRTPKSFFGRDSPPAPRQHLAAREFGIESLEELPDVIAELNLACEPSAIKIPRVAIFHEITAPGTSK